MTLDIQDVINELCSPIRHSEHYHVERTYHNGSSTAYGLNHVSEHPPLIAQLYGSLSESTGALEGARPGFASRPAARLEAIDAAMRIDAGAAGWVRRLGHDDAGDTIACVRKLGGLLPSIKACGRADRDGCCQRHGLAADIRSWWTQARILTGWDVAAWQPDNTCPLCGERGTLRVKFAIEAGTCTACHETWGPNTIGILAEHIRTESEGGGDTSWAMPIGKPCHCAACDPDYLRWRLCPKCASRWCATTYDHALPCDGGDASRQLERLTSRPSIK